MNAWLIAALALLPGFAACAYVIYRAELMDALVALNLSGVLASLELALLAEGLGQSSLYDLSLALAALTFSGAIVFARYLERWL